MVSFPLQEEKCKAVLPLSSAAQGSMSSSRSRRTVGHMETNKWVLQNILLVFYTHIFIVNNVTHTSTMLVSHLCLCHFHLQLLVVSSQLRKEIVETGLDRCSCQTALRTTIMTGHALHKPLPVLYLVLIGVTCPLVARKP